MRTAFSNRLPCSVELGANCGGKKTSIVLAHFLGYELVQQRIHAQDQFLVPLWIEGKIARLERVVLQVKEIGRLFMIPRICSSASGELKSSGA